MLTEGNFFVSKREIERLQSELKSRIIKRDKDFLDNVVKITDSTYKSALQTIESLKDKLPSYENAKIIFNQLKNINFIWALSAAHFVVVGEEMLRKRVIEENYPIEKIYEIIPKVITNLYLQNQQVIELKKEVGNKSLEEIKKDKILYEKIILHVKKYPWIEIANFIGEKLTVERLYQQIMHAKTNINENIKMNSNNISEELKFRAECMSKLGYIKQISAENFAILTEKVMPFLKKTAEKIGISYNQLLSLIKKF